MSIRTRSGMSGPPARRGGAARPSPATLLALGAACLTAVPVHAAERHDPKIVYYGAKDSPTPLEFNRSVADLVADGVPIDGTTIVLDVPDGKGGYIRPFNSVFAGTEELGLSGPFERARFDEAAALIKGAEKGYITHNFLRLESRPGDADWFDDTRWSQVVDTFRHAAYAASEAGMEGIAFDPEPYTAGLAQFDYLAQIGYADVGLDAYRCQARERGRDVMEAMQEEFPDITILSLFLNSYLVAPGFRSEPPRNPGDPRLSLVRHPYVLLNDFLTGWLQVANDRVRIIDGNEQAYYYDESADFDEAAALIREDGAELAVAAAAPDCEGAPVPPAVVRDKYRRQVEVGSTVYLDAYLDVYPAPGTSPPARPTLANGDTRTELFGRNLADALRTSEGYVWVYGEEGRFWPGTDRPAWSDSLASEIDAMSALRSTSRVGAPRGTTEAVAARRGERDRVLAFARARRDAALEDGSLAGRNQLANGDFDRNIASWGFDDDGGRAFNGGGGRPASGGHAWSEAGDDAPGSLVIAGAWAGASYQALSGLRAGEVLWVQADVSRTGLGEPSLTFAFKGADGLFLQRERASFLLPEWVPLEDRAEAAPEAWRRVEGAVVVPPGAEELVFSLGADGQRLGTTDAVAFDDVALLAVGDVSEVLPEGAGLGPSASGLANAGFESGLDGWERSGEPSPTIVDGRGRGGRVVAVSAPETGVLQALGTEPGRAFSMSASARTVGDGARGFVGVLFRDADGRNVPGAFTSERVGAGAWRRYAVVGTAPPGAVEIVAFAWQEGASGTLLADDFALEVR